MRSDAAGARTHHAANKAASSGSNIGLNQPLIHGRRRPFLRLFASGRKVKYLFSSSTSTLGQLRSTSRTIREHQFLVIYMGPRPPISHPRMSPARSWSDQLSFEHRLSLSERFPSLKHSCRAVLDLSRCGGAWSLSAQPAARNAHVRFEATSCLSHAVKGTAWARTSMCEGAQRRAVAAR